MKSRVRLLQCGINFLNVDSSSLGLFNLRGSDIDYNPVFFSYAVVGLTFVKWVSVCLDTWKCRFYSLFSLFLRDEQRSKEVRDHLTKSSGIDVTLLPYSTEEFVKSLEGLKGPEKIWVPSFIDDCSFVYFRLSCIIIRRVWKRVKALTCSLRTPLRKIRLFNYPKQLKTRLRLREWEMPTLGISSHLTHKHI